MPTENNGRILTLVSTQKAAASAEPQTTETISSQQPLEPLSKEDIDFMWDEAMDRQPGG